VGEDSYWGKGFSTCAVCDAAFYKEKNVYVVGGGDAAIEDAVALTKFASHVTMLVRGEKLRASVAMQKRLAEHADKITVRYQTQLTGIEGERVERLVLDAHGTVETVSAEGLFLAIGHIPATGFLAGSGILLDEQGYIKTGMNYPTTSWLTGYPTMTSIPGIFAAGDCVDYRYRQAATAAGMGVMAALDAEKWLEAK
jgi:thioredoxin reductase (NADPH)